MRGIIRLLSRARLKVNASCSASTMGTTLQIHSLDAMCMCPKSYLSLCQFCYRDPTRSFQVGFNTSAITMIKPEFESGSVNYGDRESFYSGEIAKEAERICTILVNHPTSSIGSALDQSGIQISQELVMEVLKKLSNAGVLALAFFRWASKQEGFKRTTEMYHLLIDALGKIKQFRLIWDLVNAMSGGGLLTRETFSLLSRRYVRAKKIKEAIKMLETMGEYGLNAELSDFNHLIDSICKSKNVKIAQQLVHDMKTRGNFSPDLKTYTILLEGWKQHLHIPKLTQVYQEMLDEGFQPDQVAYGILIHAFCKCRKLEEALEIFYEMEARNIKPGPHIYCNLINGLGADKRLDDAMKFLKKFTDSGFPPEVPIYNAAVGAYCRSQQYDKARIMLDEMRRCGVGPNTRTYDVILGHLIREKRNEEAYRLFQRMEREDGCSPELNTYTMIVRMFCIAQKVDMAIKVWRQMNKRGVLPCLHMFIVLINSLCCEKRLEEACRFFKEMLDMGLRPPEMLHREFIRALEEGGKLDWAAEISRMLYKVRNTPLEG